MSRRRAPFFLSSIPDLASRRQDQAHPFTAFHRVQTPETQSIEGAGLGLYIVKRIIEWHGGSVFFHSVYGKGVLFGFELPCVPAMRKSRV
ncbi:MAG: ATP-binding protein [Anaerolineae bacterium]